MARGNLGLTSSLRETRQVLGLFPGQRFYAYAGGNKITVGSTWSLRSLVNPFITPHGPLIARKTDAKLWKSDRSVACTAGSDLLSILDAIVSPASTFSKFHSRSVLKATHLRYSLPKSYTLPRRRYMQPNRHDRCSVSSQ